MKVLFILTSVILVLSAVYGKQFGLKRCQVKSDLLKIFFKQLFLWNTTKKCQKGKVYWRAAFAVGSSTFLQMQSRTERRMKWSLTTFLSSATNLTSSPIACVVGQPKRPWYWKIFQILSLSSHLIRWLWTANNQIHFQLDQHCEGQHLRYFTAHWELHTVRSWCCRMDRSWQPSAQTSSLQFRPTSGIPIFRLSDVLQTIFPWSDRCSNFKSVAPGRCALGSWLPWRLQRCLWRASLLSCWFTRWTTSR